MTRPSSIETPHSTIREDHDGASRSYPNPGKPALIYLPGVHGDTTLFTSFRISALDSFQIVEFTYPRTTSWSLQDYAAFVLRELHRHQIQSGWILAESYSSQVAWCLIDQKINPTFRAEGIILAGGFARYPIPLLASTVAGLIRLLPYQSWKLLFWIYGQYARFRHRNAPETKAAVDEFIRRRTPEDLSAMAHRIDLIARNDPRDIIRVTRCAIFLLAGIIDPVVLTWPVLHWLKNNCPGFAGHRLIWPADHNVLGTEPKKAAAQIALWIAHSDWFQACLVTHS